MITSPKKKRRENRYVLWAMAILLPVVHLKKQRQMELTIQEFMLPDCITGWNQK